MAPDYAWWSSLRHGGLLVAPDVLGRAFPSALPSLDPLLTEKLRRHITRVTSPDLKGQALAQAQADLLKTAFEDVAQLRDSGDGQWLRGAALGTKFSRRAITGETIRPRLVWDGIHGGLLPVFWDDEARIGVGRGKRAVSRVLEWLRKGGERLALLTNGRQFRLVYAASDHDAFAQWDVDLWFTEGQPGPQVEALRILLSPLALTPQEDGKPCPLLAAILDSRKGQSALSTLLGERVRQAVEILVRSHAPALVSLQSPIDARDLYRGACRVVMRLVVLLFAEAREGLLPVENDVYHDSYGLRGLREQFDRRGGLMATERLRHSFSAWPRLLGLFRLVFEGSHHEALPVTRYGGGLFIPGGASSADGVSRAVALFESACFDPSLNGVMADDAVACILDLITRTRARVRQGGGSQTVSVPVNFSDLSSEYIGILYEGLLDYELKRAGEGDPVLFLSVGDEPALPLSALTGLPDSALASLVEKLGKAKAAGTTEDDDTDDEDVSDEVEAPEGDTEVAADAGVPADAAIEAVEEPQVGADDARRAARAAATTWARRAVIAGGLVARPRSKKPEAVVAYETAAAAKAEALVKEIVLPGEWYLVRWGGTRKGAGTFYTRPQLAVPTAQRTLRPLAYIPPSAADGTPNEDAPAAEWTPLKPEEILELKVCDPAMGSGSFLVAALRFLTQALFESLHHHKRIAAQASGTLVTLAEGKPSVGGLSSENLPTRPEDADFEPRLKARLKRYVVERCLYGVDIDPLAVELARLSLWVETMDRDLPFEFLDHRLKAGNSLVGCWFDRYRDYPLMAWEREGGDEKHERFVHHRATVKKTGKKAGQIEETGNIWGRAISSYYKDVVKPSLVDWIEGQSTLFPEPEGDLPAAFHHEAATLFEELHSFDVQNADERARFYRERIEKSASLQRLKEAFDTWSALWFWPADRLASAPLPANLANPPAAAQAVTREVTSRERFFHWELEFPDVFTAADSGFDAILGNPPWEIQKPNSKEFFSGVDPLYRTYGKQEALGKQRECFSRNADDEERWLAYVSRLKALSNWTKNAAFPFGEPGTGRSAISIASSKKDNESLHNRWSGLRARQEGFADPAHPFRHQGSADVNTYKMFLESVHALTRRDGLFGLIVPSGLYTDKGSLGLRTLLLDSCRWEWLFSFENREKIFDIHSAFKFGPVIARKGGETTAIHTVFMRHSLSDWEEAEKYVISYARESVAGFSPNTLSLLEIRHPRDLEILEKLYSNSVLLGDDSTRGWGIKYSTEFHMTNDSHLFKPRPWWEERGYTRDEYDRWIGPAEAVALPLYEGRMIGQFDFSQQAWVSGKGRSAVWTEISWESKHLAPQFLMDEKTFTSAPLNATGESGVVPGRKVGFMAIGSATNARSLFSASLVDAPCGNAVPVLTCASSPLLDLSLTVVLNSFVFDAALRARLGGLNLNYFVLAECPLPEASLMTALDAPDIIAARLGWAHLRYAAEWHTLASSHRILRNRPWKSLWAISEFERLRLRCMLDAIVAATFGLTAADLSWILGDSDLPAARLRDRNVRRSLNPKGFWRIDKEKDPELRQTVLTLVAFRELQERIATQRGDRPAGVRAFCNQNDGDGWMPPDALRIKDYELGHDERAEVPQPVAARLGPRFLPWQLEQTVEESWAECEQHAAFLDSSHRMVRRP